MTLKQLQAEWRAKSEMLATGVPDFSDGVAAGSQECADALTPFILQQKRDSKLIAELAGALQAELSVPGPGGSVLWAALLKEARSRLKEME